MSIVSGEKTRDLEGLETVRFVASALFDVSAEKIGRLRDAFEKNGIFYNDISALYESVKRTAIARGDMPATKTGTPKKMFVAFTSNVRFYGSVNTDVMRTFLEALPASGVDAIVIGRTGQAFMENEGGHRPMKYLSFEADEPTKAELQGFLDQVASYDEVHVFYPSFVNVFAQKVGSIDITHSAAPAGAAAPETEVDYIFEPELPQIIRFFETRVRYLLFQRTALESELARTAARLFAMNRAQDRADEEIKSVRIAIRKDEETFNDLRLLESFSGISRWKQL